MTILLAQEFALRIVKTAHTIWKSSPERTATHCSSDQTKLRYPVDGEVKQLILRIDTAVEFPLIFLAHPLIPNSAKTCSEPPPRAWPMALQVGLLILVELACEAYCPKFTSAKPREGAEGDGGRHVSDDGAAAKLADEFAMPRATLLFVPIVIVSLKWVVNLVGTLHFLSVVFWLLIRSGLRVRA